MVPGMHASINVCACPLNVFQVFLSWMPYYYEFKLSFMIWLVFFDGADRLYRFVHTYFRKAYTLATKIGILKVSEMVEWDEEDFLDTLHPGVAQVTCHVRLV